MDPNEVYPSPIETPDDLPPRRRPVKWIWFPIGFIPSLLLLLMLLITCFGQEWTSEVSSKAKANVFFFSIYVFVPATPLVLIPWAHLLLKAIHGPIPAGKRALRIGLISVLTVVMTVVNYLVGIAGLLAAAVFFVFENGIIAH